MAAVLQLGEEVWLEVDALTVAGRESLESGEIGAAERAFSAALRRVPSDAADSEGAGAPAPRGLAALSKLERARHDLHFSRAEARLQLGLQFGALDDSMAALALASTPDGQALHKRVELALRGVTPSSPAKQRDGAASFAAALRMRPGGRRRRVGGGAGWWSEGIGSPSKTEHDAQLPAVGQRRSAAATAVQEVAEAEANSELQRAALSGKLDEETMRLLLQHGASVSEPDMSGRTVLRLALANGQHRVVHMLLEYCYRQLWVRQRLMWARATDTRTAVYRGGRSCAAGLAPRLAAAVAAALERRCREETAGLDKLVLRHLLERRELSFARDFGAATGAALVGGEAARQTVQAADDLVAALDSPEPVRRKTKRR